MELAGQFDNASTFKDYLRKAYEKCNDIPQENLGSCHEGIKIPEFSPEKAVWRTPSLLPPPRQLRISRSCSLAMVCFCVLDRGGLLVITVIHLNGAFHLLKLEDIMDGLMHFKLNIKDYDHPILTSIKIHQGLHRVRYFFKPLGNNLPICIVMPLPLRFYLEGKMFESHGCLLAVLRHYFSSREFTIYEMRKGCSVWSVRYLVNSDDIMNPLPEGWSIWFTVWSIVLGERKEDSCLVINLYGKVVQYNLISKTLHEIYDIGYNQLDDNLVDDELIMPFGADHSVYEFIPSSASV
ncbi:hypothetical protein Tco_0697973 [Tanacetum coccineum]